MAKTIRIARWVAVLAALMGLSTAPILTACDCFLTIGGYVTDCATTTPIAGVTITMHVDDGFNQGMTLSTTATTKADGSFGLSPNQNCGDTVTLQLAKPGYAVLDHQVKGTPTAPLALCLTPAP